MFLSSKGITYPARMHGDNLAECTQSYCKSSSRRRRTVDSSITFNLPVKTNIKYNGISFCRMDESKIDIHFERDSHNETQISWSFRDQDSSDVMFHISKFIIRK